jgi:TatD DNase family protein
MLLDAHNHLHDARLAPWRQDILRELSVADVKGAVANGTREDDWAQVAELAGEHCWVWPSFGLHPWYVAGRTPDWRETLLRFIESHPGCGIGEIGLDRWIEGYDLPAQIQCFTWQLELAAERNLPATVHCLRAWGALWDIVRDHPVPARGFLLHAYGGPAEMVDGFVGHGAYFSFSPYFLHARKGTQRDVFRHLPADRLLVETDAPDLAPPPERNAHPLPDHDGKVVNHPANLTVAYEGLAEIRGWTVEELAERVAENFTRLFGEPGLSK